MSHDYSEDQLIQRSTAEFLEQELGWQRESQEVYCHQRRRLEDQAEGQSLLHLLPHPKVQRPQGRTYLSRPCYHRDE